MADLALCRELCRRIRHRWRAPQALDPEVRHYLGSALGADSGDKIARLLDDPWQCHAAGLIDLLLDPDPPFLVGLDALMEAADFSDADTDAIVAGLGHPPWHIAVIPGLGLPAQTLAVSADAAHRLVARMGIAQRIDPGLNRTINAELPADCRAGARVCLRRQRHRLSRHHMEFVQRFLEKRVCNDKGLVDELARVLGLLEQLPVAEPVCSALARRRDVLAAALDSLEVYTQRLRAGAMETIMLEGMQIPYIDAVQTIATLDLIDRLNRTLCR